MNSQSSFTYLVFHLLHDSFGHYTRGSYKQDAYCHLTASLQFTFMSQVSFLVGLNTEKLLYGRASISSRDHGSSLSHMVSQNILSVLHLGPDRHSIHLVDKI